MGSDASSRLLPYSYLTQYVGGPCREAGPEAQLRPAAGALGALAIAPHRMMVLLISQTGIRSLERI